MLNRSDSKTTNNGGSKRRQTDMETDEDEQQQQQQYQQQLLLHQQYQQQQQQQQRSSFNYHARLYSPRAISPTNSMEINTNVLNEKGVKFQDELVFSNETSSCLSLNSSSSSVSSSSSSSSSSSVNNLGINDDRLQQQQQQQYQQLKQKQLELCDEEDCLENLMTSKNSIHCNIPEVIGIAQEISKKIKTLKNDEERNYVIQTVLSSCRPRQLQFISKLIQPHLQRNFIGVLPAELSLQILSNLDPLSLCRASRVSKRWKQLIDDETLWKRQCERFHFEVSREYSFSTVSYFPWKEFFKRKYRVYMNWMKGGDSTIQHLNAHPTGVVTCLHFDDKRIISGSDDCTIKIWSIQTGKPLRVVRRRKKKIFFF